MSAEGLQRVNSPGPYIQFDAAAYAAAAAARTASPGELVCKYMMGMLLARVCFDLVLQLKSFALLSEVSACVLADCQHVNVGKMLLQNPSAAWGSSVIEG